MPAIKKFIAMLLICVMVVSVGSVGVFAHTEKDREMIINCGLLKDENGNIRLEDNITRAEFCRLICNVLGFSDVADADISNIDKFDDVSEEHPLHNYIYMAKKLGLVIGNGSGMFMPDDAIVFCDATKIIVCAMGYDGMAKAHGGYPNGYIMVGMECGVLKMNGQIRDEVKRSAAVDMICNALDIPFMSEKDRIYQLLDGKNGTELITLRKIMREANN